MIKLRPDFEVVCANILNRARLPSMDEILGKLLREETRIATQAALERGDIEYFLLRKLLGKHHKRIFLRCRALNVKRMAISRLIARKEICVFIANNQGILFLNALSYDRKGKIKKSPITEPYKPLLYMSHMLLLLLLMLLVLKEAKNHQYLMKFDNWYRTLSPLLFPLHSLQLVYLIRFLICLLS